MLYQWSATSLIELALNLFVRPQRAVLIRSIASNRLEMKLPVNIYVVEKSDTKVTKLQCGTMTEATKSTVFYKEPAARR